MKSFLRALKEGYYDKEIKDIFDRPQKDKEKVNVQPIESITEKDC
jgi:hypothetical protein